MALLLIPEVTKLNNDSFLIANILQTSIVVVVQISSSSPSAFETLILKLTM